MSWTNVQSLEIGLNVVNICLSSRCRRLVLLDDITFTYIYYATIVSNELRKENSMTFRTPFPVCPAFLQYQPITRSVSISLYSPIKSERPLWMSPKP